MKKKEHFKTICLYKYENEEKLKFPKIQKNKDKSKKKHVQVSKLFVQAIKIIVDSWKLSMLLLYIL